MTDEPLTTPAELPPAEMPLELQRFMERCGRHRLIVTWGLLPVLIAVFGLQLLWGATNDLTTLVRAGALVTELVEQGEWYRLGSATLLHGDFMHLAFNAYVLFALGSFLEKVLGSWRTLALYCGAALGGSLVSMVAMDGISVGASGALFGFLGGHAVLAFGRTGLVPEAALPGVRKAAVINLGLNVANSLRPNIDWAAHLGGLILGVLLVGLVLRRGLPTLDEPDRPARKPWGSIVFGSVGLLWLAASLATCWATQRPFAAGDGPAWVPASHEGLPFTFALPEQLSSVEGAQPPTWGRFPMEPAVISIGMASFDPVEPAGVEGVLADIRAQLGQAEVLPDGISRKGSPEIIQTAAGPALMSMLDLGDGVGQQVFLPTPIGTIMVESAWMRARNDWGGLSEKVVDSIEIPAQQ